MSTKYTALLSKLRQSFASGKTRSVEYRKTQLKGLSSFLTENEALIVSALNEDLRKPSFETRVHEIALTLNEIKGQLFNIDDYVAPQTGFKSLMSIGDTPFIKPEPYGLVLVMGCWNYPIQLSLFPLIGAIAAGNVAVLKLPELVPSTAKLLADLLPKYLDTDCYQIILCEVEETKQLLTERFDYIFFIGSSAVGNSVHQSAAQHLTPTTLELGGKCPVYVDESVSDMKMVWRRILWGKMMNAGQTCVAPDYLLCTESVKNNLIENAPNILKDFYGTDPKSSLDFGRIVNERHFKRLEKLLSSGKAIIGGDKDSTELYIAPTVLIDVSPNDPVMCEEIFGPILAVIVVKDLEEAIDFINSREKALALYVFSEQRTVIDRFLNETSSGTVCANDTIFQICDTLPFGGVGNSGMGVYHGKAVFDTFSHKKSVLIRGYNPVLEWVSSMRNPPYADIRVKALSLLMSKRKSYIPKNSVYYLIFFFGFITCFLLKRLEYL